jgi:adenosylcobinamide kinase / adenosylcobinamide-phosphate guanylyltransferase
MRSTTLIIGGCRSGKSRHALFLADQISGPHKIFVATCVPQDDEMAARVQRHQRERGAHWHTVESAHDPAGTIAQHGADAAVMLIDCLTMWMSHLVMTHHDDAVIQQHVDRLCAAITHAPCPIIVVTNEVGTGIVPDNALARRFRDLAGWCNQSMATACRQVIWMVAGIAVNIKESL